MSLTQLHLMLILSQNPTFKILMFLITVRGALFALEH